MPVRTIFLCWVVCIVGFFGLYCLIFTLSQKARGNLIQLMNDYILTKDYQKRVPSKYTGKFTIKNTSHGDITVVLDETKNGYHCLTGPAVVHNTTHEWFVDGIRHRIDGPAVYYYKNPKSDHHEYWINGERFNSSVYWNNPLVMKHKLNKILNDLP